MWRGLSVAVAALLLIAAVLVVSMRESKAQVPVADGKMILLTSSDGNQDTVVVYHRASSAFLVYGHTGNGLSLLKIRKLETDFKLAGLVDEIKHSRNGYPVEYVKGQYAKLKKKAVKRSPVAPACPATPAAPAKKGP
jgi:hypothetical protein